MTSIARRNTAERAKAQEKAEAEAALDAILDDAIAEFEEEEDLSQKAEDAGADDKVASLLSGDRGALRVDKALEQKMRENAYDNLDTLVENLRNPAFKETLTRTLRALSGNEEGVRTIEQFMNDQRLRAEAATPSEAPTVELDRSVATTMELLAKSSTDMEGMETAQVEQFGDEMMTNMIAEFERLGQKEDFNQIVENMMRQLLARDLMYEPMKLVCEKYPEWLAEKYESLSKDESAAPARHFFFHGSTHSSNAGTSGTGHSTSTSSASSRSTRRSPTTSTGSWSSSRTSRSTARSRRRSSRSSRPRSSSARTACPS